MKRIAATLMAILLPLFLFACRKPEPLPLTQVESQKKLEDFLKIFDYSESKSYRFVPTGEMTVNDSSSYGFEVYWVESDGETYMGEYAVNAYDGTLAAVEETMGGAE